MKTFNKKLTRAFAVAAAVVCMSASVVYAAQVLLTPKQVAEEMFYPAIAAAFESENSIETNITQTDAGYIVSFLGLATGVDLAELEGAAQNSTYAVIAISKENGEAMTTTEEFFISPIICGRNPLQYSALTMGGGYTKTVMDGVLYRIVSCDSIEIFAHEGIQLCVNSGWMYDQSAFTMDANTTSEDKTNDCQFRRTFHSDQGWGYQMKAYSHMLKENKVFQSMSRKGNCHDNLPMENFFGLLKQELYCGNVYRSYDELKTARERYIHYYNHV